MTTIHNHIPRDSFASRLLVAGLCIAMLAGCSTTRKTADASASADAVDTSEDASGILAKGGTKASGTYVDPMVATARGRKLAQNGMPVGPQMGGTPMQNALTQHSPSIAAAVTEPTGVRAGSVSIFSSHTAATATAAAFDSPLPKAASQAPVGGSVNAMTRSVFSAGTPVACGNDAQGNMISC